MEGKSTVIFKSAFLCIYMHVLEHVYTCVFLDLLNFCQRQNIQDNDITGITRKVPARILEIILFEGNS